MVHQGDLESFRCSIDSVALPILILAEDTQLEPEANAALAPTIASAHFMTALVSWQNQRLSNHVA